MAVSRRRSWAAPLTDASRASLALASGSCPGASAASALPAASARRLGRLGPLADPLRARRQPLRPIERLLRAASASWARLPAERAPGAQPSQQAGVLARRRVLGGRGAGAAAACGAWGSFCPAS